MSPEHDESHAGHSHGVSADADARKLGIALGLILGFMAFELVVGLVAHSLALLSDAAHMLTDAAAIGLSIVAIRLATRPAKGALLSLAWVGWGAHAALLRRFQVLMSGTDGEQVAACAWQGYSVGFWGSRRRSSRVLSSIVQRSWCVVGRRRGRALVVVSAGVVRRATTRARGCVSGVRSTPARFGS